MTSARLDALDIWDDSSGLRAISPAKVLALVAEIDRIRAAAFKCELDLQEACSERDIARVSNAQLQAAVARETERAEKAERELRALTDAYDARSKLFHDQEAFYVEQAKRLAKAEALLRPLAECDPDIREWLGEPRWSSDYVEPKSDIEKRLEKAEARLATATALLRFARDKMKREYDRTDINAFLATSGGQKVWWLIERGSPAEWMQSYDYGSVDWTSDPQKAEKFVEREHAERFIATSLLRVEENVRVCEHVFIDAEPKSDGATTGLVSASGGAPSNSPDLSAPPLADLLRAASSHEGAASAGGGAPNTSASNEGPRCPVCGERVYSVPRMGIFHVCKSLPPEPGCKPLL